MFETIINLFLPLAVIIVAMITGSILEKNHYKSIKKREAITQGLPIMTGKQFPADRPVVEVDQVSVCHPPAGGRPRPSDPARGQTAVPP